MSRARYLKPTFFTNERIGELDPLERLAWQGLWCQADREGRLKDRPKSLKIEVLPYDDCDFDAILDSLQEAGFIVRYVAAGERYISIPSFVEHQRPHPKEPASIIPAPSMTHASAMHEPSMSHSTGKLPGKDPYNGMIIKSESESESRAAAREDEADDDDGRSHYLGIPVPAHLRDAVIEHCLALGNERSLDAETIAEIVQLHEDLPPERIAAARRELRRETNPRRRPFAANVREVDARLNPNQPVRSAHPTPQRHYSSPRIVIPPVVLPDANRKAGEDA